MKKNIIEAGNTDIEALKKAIDALESPKVKRERERVVKFGALYPSIREKLNAEVSKSAIVKALAEYGMSISGSVFDKLLADEAKRRGEPVPGSGAGAAGDDVAGVESMSASHVGGNSKEIH